MKSSRNDFRSENENGIGFHSGVTNGATGETSAEFTITVKNGVATLFGTTDSQTGSMQIENLISRAHGIDRVINLMQ